MRHPESLEQQAFVQWCDLHPQAKRIFAIPNGGKRSKIEAAIMRGEGVRAGVPDLMLPVPVGAAHGLFVEMKSKEGRVTPSQRERAEQLASDGYVCIVAYSADIAITATKLYLTGGLPVGAHDLKPQRAGPR